MVTYEQWNKAILSYVFEDCEAEQLVFLETHEETLAEIAEFANFNVPDAAESLKAAVRNKVVRGNRMLPWQILPSETTFWTACSKKEPPQVAFLALTVLAASLMESTDGVFHTNYYFRLNQLLFEEPYPNKPKGIALRQIEKFWKHLQEWVSNRHDAHLYLHEHASQKYVWYPRSQCLIRKHDRRAIYNFFRAAGLTPFSTVTESELTAQLLDWAQSAAGDARIKHYLANVSHKVSILNQVKSLLKHWDGQISPPLPPKHLHVPIAVGLRFNPFDNDSVEIRYWLPRRGRGDINCEGNPLGIERLQTFSSEKWFRPAPDENGTFWKLTDAVRLRTVEAIPVVYTLDTSDIWVFREDSERDDSWVSQRNMQLYEEHLIVFRARDANQVTTCLKETCGLGIAKPRVVRVGGKKNGWCYLKVKPTRRLDYSDPRLWRLSVDSSKQIRLIGGLSAKDRCGSRGYLEFCLPTVFVPDIGLPDSEPLKVGLQQLPIGEDRLVWLENTLEPGVHQISCGHKTKELRVITPERSLVHQNQTLTVALSENVDRIPPYSMKKIPEVSAASGLWLTGAKFLGANIPETTWDDVREPPCQTDDIVTSPAELISSVVKVAIALKQGDTEVPAWFDTALAHLDRHVALRALVEKKLQQYGEAALSYADFCQIKELDV